MTPPVPGSATTGRHPVGEPLLELERISKRFPDGTEAIADLTLSVSAGEFVAVVGASGCGKTAGVPQMAGV